MKLSQNIITSILLIISVNIYSANVWSGYVDITSDFTLDQGKVLVIQPGTVIRVAHDSKILIKGLLIAVGTESEPIRFTSYDPEFSEYDYWRGIEFNGAHQDTSRMTYCIVENIRKIDEKGSIHMTESWVTIRNSLIHNNLAESGGGINVNSSYLTLLYSTIENNTATNQGGGIFIANTVDNYNAVWIVKNVIKDNSVVNAQKYTPGGGGICVSELVPFSSDILISENDIISNKILDNRGARSGTGGGVYIMGQYKYEVELTRNNIMYNESMEGGGLSVFHDTNYDIPRFQIKNNIISNNTSDDLAGGVYYNVGNTDSPQRIEFQNNTIVNNLNYALKEGAGGLYMKFNSDLGNYFLILNCIFRNNKNNSSVLDIRSYPNYNPANYVRFSNTTFQLDGTGNIDDPPLFYRMVEYAGSDPYENYKRGDYHLSLESPCVDAGDPEYTDPDGSRMNMGAYGGTGEATTSDYGIIHYNGENISINVKENEVYLLDAREYTKSVNLNNVTIQDGGQLFMATNDNYRIQINITTLETYGKKIGNDYSTRLQKHTDTFTGEGYTSNEMNITNVNCTGVQFNNMSVNVNSANPSNIIDSRVYIYDFDENLKGINVISPDANIINTTIDNFGIGIYLKGTGKAASKGRIANNKISFDADAASKGESVAKGIKVENTDAQISNNEVINPNEGIEASSSSGRIANNKVSFEPDAASKSSVSPKRGIYLYGGADYEVDHNSIKVSDMSTQEIRAVDVENSAINAHYNVIDFGTLDLGKNSRVGFYTYNMTSGSYFVNNTIYNSNYGLLDTGTSDYLRIINNIFYGPATTSLSSNRRNFLLYNNAIKGSFNPSSIEDEYANLMNIDPKFQSTKVSDYYLWKDSKCIDAGMYLAEYHTFNVNFYGDAPDMGAVEFYVLSTLDSPSNVTVTANATTVSLNWNSVDYAASYKIYRSSKPYSGFVLIGSTSNTYLSTSTGGAAKYFYYVKASDQPAGKSVPDDITDTDQKTVKIKKINLKKEVLSK